jgi:hypothetical protein
VARLDLAVEKAGSREGRKAVVAEPLRVEAPSVDLAHALMERLHAFPTELGEGERSCEVRVLLVGNPDRAVVDVLNGVDEWLIEHKLDMVRVHLDERVYTLTPPR